MASTFPQNITCAATSAKSTIPRQPLTSKMRPKGVTARQATRHVKKPGRHVLLPKVPLHQLPQRPNQQPPIGWLPAGLFHLTTPINSKVTASWSRLLLTDTLTIMKLCPRKATGCPSW